MKRYSSRLNLTVNREMRVALEVLAAKTGLTVTTQAMVVLRQALDRTISSEPVKLRVAQEGAFATRDEWLASRRDDAYVHNAVATADGEDADAPPA